MVMSYVGTLKTVLYLPIFAVAGTSVWSVRLLMVLSGALTIWFFYCLAVRVTSRNVALLACALLATDPAFLLPDTFDWGPVALQQLLLVTACLILVRSVEPAVSNSALYLGFGFFFLGLALWNKAVFLWTLAGLFFGTLAIWSTEIRHLLRPRNVTFVAAGFLLGASPIIIYNLQNPNITIESSGHFEASRLAGKLRMEYNTLNGSGVLGFIPAEEWRDHPKEPSSRRGRAALWIRNHFGEHRTDGLAYAFILGVLAVPLWWHSRAARFSLVFLITAWFAMALTRGAGGAVHHSVLLWPFPHLFIAIVLSSVPWSRVGVFACVVLVAFNLLVVNQHILQLERDGAEGNFTDALFSLSNAVADPTGAAPDQPIYVLDWGMLNTLELFHHGRLLLRPADGPFMTDTPSDIDLRTIQLMLSDPNALFINHVPAREEMPGVIGRFERTIEKNGYEKRSIRIIPDSNGHPVFEIFQLRKIGTA
jgi:4-amino-4-deoxy-L-arabinose transferase-like glycosyltransferase